mgnify:CR=1 FL=1
MAGFEEDKDGAVILHACAEWAVTVFGSTTVGLQLRYQPTGSHEVQVVQLGMSAAYARDIAHALQTEAARVDPEPSIPGTTRH